MISTAGHLDLCVLWGAALWMTGRKHAAPLHVLTTDETNKHYPTLGIHTRTTELLGETR